MNCETFNKLTEKEKKEFFAKLAHSAKESEHFFYLCSQIISMAEKRGLFENVKFN